MKMNLKNHILGSQAITLNRTSSITFTLQKFNQRFRSSDTPSLIVSITFSTR